MQQITLEITGRTPLMQHNVRLADPIDPETKAVSEAVSHAKKTKTDAAWQKAYKTEWRAGLYYGADTGVYIPARSILASLVRGGVQYGKKGLAVTEALMLTEQEVPLAFADHGLTPEDLWTTGKYHDVRAVGVGRNKIMRCRPIFRTWGLNTTAILDTDHLNLDTFVAICEKAGMLAGLGDGRRIQMGRYEASIEVGG